MSSDERLAEQGLLAERLQTTARPRETPDRAEKRRVAQQRISRWESVFRSAVDRYVRRQRRVVGQKLAGAKSRKGTPYWSPPGVKALEASAAFDRLRWDQELVEELDPLVRAVYEETYAEVGLGYEPDAPAARTARLRWALLALQLNAGTLLQLEGVLLADRREDKAFGAATGAAAVGAEAAVSVITVAQALTALGYESEGSTLVRLLLDLLGFGPGDAPGRLDLRVPNYAAHFEALERRALASEPGPPEERDLAPVTRSVDAVFEEAETRRSPKLALDLAVGASNEAQLTVVQESGVALSKTWFSSRDDRVRPTHQEADGQTVPVDQPFTVGAWLMQFPHDPSGGVEETVNCRCTMLFETAFSKDAPADAVGRELADLRASLSLELKVWREELHPRDALGRFRRIGSGRGILRRVDAAGVATPRAAPGSSWALRARRAEARLREAAEYRERRRRVQFSRLSPPEREQLREAEERVRPYLGKDGRVDLSHASPESAARAADALEYSATRWPHVADDLSRVEVVSLPKGVLSHAENGVLLLSQEYFGGDPSVIDEAYAKTAALGWHVPVPEGRGLEAVVVHELAQNYYRSAEQMGRGVTAPGAVTEGQPVGLAVALALRDVGVHASIRYDEFNPANYWRNTEHREKVRDGLSGYASVSPEQAAGDAFVEVATRRGDEQARPIARAVVESLDQFVRDRAEVLLPRAETAEPEGQPRVVGRLEDSKPLGPRQRVQSAREIHERFQRQRDERAAARAKYDEENPGWRAEVQARHDEIRAQEVEIRRRRKEERDAAYAAENRRRARQGLPPVQWEYEAWGDPALRHVPVPRESRQRLASGPDPETVASVEELEREHATWEEVWAEYQRRKTEQGKRGQETRRASDPLYALEQDLREEFPQLRKVDLHGSLSGPEVHPEVAEHVADGLRRMMRKYPDNPVRRVEVYDYVHSPRGWGHDSRSLWAEWLPETGSLLVNQAWTADPVRTETAIAESQRKGFHPRSRYVDFSAVVEHEFGHALHTQTRKVFGRKSGERYFTFEELVEQQLRSRGLTDDSLGVSLIDPRKVREQLSGYAATNGNELVAEAFVAAEDFPEDVSPLAKTIHDELVRYVAEGPPEKPRPPVRNYESDRMRQRWGMDQRSGPAPAWTKPKPEWDADDDWETNHQRQSSWNLEVRRALSRGDLTYDEAHMLGYYDNGHDSRESFPGAGWQPLPPVLYHVTTAADAVLREGLRSRDELGQSLGHGLGGGESDTVSLTADTAVAGQIRRAMLEARAVARGEFTVADMVEQARTGRDVDHPFLSEMMDYWMPVPLSGDRPEWTPSDPLPSAVQDLVDGQVTVRGVATVDEFRAKHGAGWVPVGKSFRAESGDEVYVAFRGPAEPDERVRKAVDFWKIFVGYRERAGGPTDPLFFLSDWKALAETPADQVQVVEVRPKPGSQGYPLSALGEWRTVDGGVLEVVGAASTALRAEVEEPEWEGLPPTRADRGAAERDLFGDLVSPGDPPLGGSLTAARRWKTKVARDLAAAFADVPAEDVLRSVAESDDDYSDRRSLSFSASELRRRLGDPDYLFFALPSVDGLPYLGSMRADADPADYPTGTPGTRKFPGWDAAAVKASAVPGDSPEAAALAREFAVSQLVHQWAKTANDHDPKSLALQEAVALEFGLTEYAPVRVFENDLDADLSLVRERAQDDLAVNENVYRRFARAQYEATQELLREKGVRELVLYRGTSNLPELVSDPRPEGGDGGFEATATLRPASSWTTAKATAASFTGFTYEEFEGWERRPFGIIKAVVPAERVLSLPLTGQGSLDESEVRVLAGPGRVLVYPSEETRGDSLAQYDQFDRVKTARPPTRLVLGDPLDEDWLRTQGWDLPTDADSFLAVVLPGQLAHFLTLPAALAMPDSLRRELAERGLAGAEPVPSLT